MRKQLQMSSDFGVIYLLTNPQHAARLVVSITSLRRFYSGPITLLVTRNESVAMSELLIADSRLDIAVRKVAEAPHKKNGAFVTKTWILDQSPYEATLFLDADTLVVGPIDELVTAIGKHPLVVTGFCHWHTTRPEMKSRFDSWESAADMEGDVFELRSLLNLSKQNSLPVINAGVFGFQRQCPTLGLWRALCEFGQDRVLPDEMALQLLLPTIAHCLMPTKFNCAPVFTPAEPDVRIWHFVGTTHMLHAESREVWQMAYDQCRDDNIANIRAWSRFEETEGELPAAYKPFRGIVQA